MLLRTSLGHGSLQEPPAFLSLEVLHFYFCSTVRHCALLLGQALLGIPRCGLGHPHSLIAGSGCSTGRGRFVCGDSGRGTVQEGHGSLSAGRLVRYLIWEAQKFCFGFSGKLLPSKGNKRFSAAGVGG